MKNTLIIGGSSGIGLEITKLLALKNKVYILSRRSVAIENCKYIEFDALNDTVDLSQLPDTIDQFIYCPGTINLKPFTNLKLDDFRTDMELNFLALVRHFQNILPALTKSSSASALFFSTVAVQSGMPFHSSIAAAKGALEGFTRAIAAEYASKIRVNAIAPSLTNTELANRFLNNDRKIEMAQSRNPMHKIGDPSQIAKTAVHLISDDADWITGQIIAIDGGMGTLKTQ